ncbi:hypothetical protein ACWE42_24530 [Sutcliffiella cohnii]
MGKKKNNDAAWVEAKKRCRLNQADIQMAKELGMTPKGLLKNIPAPNQQWKAPVNVWIRDLYESKFGKVLSVKTSSRPKKVKQDKPVSDDYWDPDDLPF